FLLGRAIILSVVSPFAVAFLATIWFVHRDKSAKVMLAVLAGALTYKVTHGAFIMLAMLVFIFLAALFKNKRNLQITIPSLVIISTVTPRLFLYSIAEKMTFYEWMIFACKCVLRIVLVLIFRKSIPLLSSKIYKPK